MKSKIYILIFLFFPVIIKAVEPHVPTLIRKFDNAIFNPYPPPYRCTLSVVSIDPDGDNINYEINWGTDPDFTSHQDTIIGVFPSGVPVEFSIPLN